MNIIGHSRVSSKRGSGVMHVFSAFLMSSERGSSVMHVISHFILSGEGGSSVIHVIGHFLVDGERGSYGRGALNALSVTAFPTFLHLARTSALSHATSATGER
jgi:hypothetical protein